VLAAEHFHNVSERNLTMSLKFRFLLAIASLFAACALPSNAQQRGQYMPGQVGLNAGVLPSPGFTYSELTLNYSSSRLNDANGNATAVTGDYKVWAIENVFYYVPDIKVLGGKLGFMAMVPTLANGSLEIPEYGVNGGGYGLADTWLQPFTLGWHLKRADLYIGDGIMVPTGRYTPGASNNVGFGFVGNHLISGTTVYITKNKGTTANIFTDWEVHTKKNGTDYTAGQAFTDEWGFGQVLPLNKQMTKLMQLGAVGYDQWQVTQNGGTIASQPASLLPFYAVHAAGLLVFFKYYWEYKAQAHSLGNTTTFGISWTLRDPKESKP
jgi:hypothetical protein